MGQAVFDRLLKACGEVAWKGETSIQVLDLIQVDAPYRPEDCKIIPGAPSSSRNGSLEASSLDRVKKIVAAANTDGAAPAGGAGAGPSS